MIDHQRVVALVPIKEHSERVPGKNFRDFCGKPLYEHILHTLDRAGAVDQILIDTDSDRVIRCAPGLSRKIHVIQRPAELRGDCVSMNKVIAHDLEHAEADLFVQTHATNPLLRSSTITKGVHTLLEDDVHDSLFSVNAYYSRFYTPDGTPINHDPTRLVRTQDLDPLYEENSCLYVFTRASFAATGRRIGRNPAMYVTPKVESIDIDDEFGFRLAELLAGYGVEE